MTAQTFSRSRGAVSVDLAMAAATGAALCLLALHLVQPGLDPGWSVVSQYALGANGWIVPAMFLLLGAACALLAMGLPAERLRRAGRVGRILLLVATFGLTVSSIFVVGTPLHDVGSLLGNGGLAIAAVLVGRDLRRGFNRPVVRWSAFAAHAPWVLAFVMAGLIAANTWGVGLANRAIVIGYVVWIVLAARQAASRQPATNR